MRLKTTFIFWWFECRNVLTLPVVICCIFVKQFYLKNQKGRFQWKDRLHDSFSIAWNKQIFLISYGILNFFWILSSVFFLKLRCLATGCQLISYNHVKVHFCAHACQISLSNRRKFLFCLAMVKLRFRKLYRTLLESWSTANIISCLRARVSDFISEEVFFFV